jgi:hypothetical protein
MMKAQKTKQIKKVMSDFKKGTPSKTMKGKLDFSTKSTSKFFDRGGKREKTAQGSTVKRRPYTKKT